MGRSNCELEGEIKSAVYARGYDERDRFGDQLLSHYRILPDRYELEVLVKEVRFHGELLETREKIIEIPDLLFSRSPSGFGSRIEFELFDGETLECKISSVTGPDINDVVVIHCSPLIGNVFNDMVTIAERDGKIYTTFRSYDSDYRYTIRYDDEEEAHILVGEDKSLRGQGEDPCLSRHEPGTVIKAYISMNRIREESKIVSGNSISGIVKSFDGSYFSEYEIEGNKRRIPVISWIIERMRAIYYSIFDQQGR